MLGTNCKCKFILEDQQPARTNTYTRCQLLCCRGQRPTSDSHANNANYFTVIVYENNGNVLLKCKDANILF